MLGSTISGLSKSYSQCFIALTSCNTILRLSMSETRKFRVQTIPKYLCIEIIPYFAQKCNCKVLRVKFIWQHCMRTAQWKPLYFSKMAFTSCAYKWQLLYQLHQFEMAPVIIVGKKLLDRSLLFKLFFSFYFSNLCYSLYLVITAIIRAVKIVLQSKQLHFSMIKVDLIQFFVSFYFKLYPWLLLLTMNFSTWTTLFRIPDVLEYSQ